MISFLLLIHHNQNYQSNVLIIFQIIWINNRSNNIQMYYDFMRIYKQITKGQKIEIGNFQKLFGSKSRLQYIQQKDIKVNGICQLLLSLIKLNIPKFILTVFIFIIQLVLTVTSPLFTNWIIENYLNQYQQNSFFFLIFILLGYKICKMLNSIILDLCHQSIGFQYFAKLYYHILTNYNILNGKILNLIQYDCNILVYFAYALLFSFFNFVELVVIIILIIYYLQKAQHLYIFAIIIVLFIVSQLLVNFLTFKYNKTYLNGKDYRLGSNIDNQNQQQTIKKRQAELKYNRWFLNLKIVDKFLIFFFPMMINIYVFVIVERSSIKEVQYIIFMLINLIRIPINTLIQSINFMVIIVSSADRILGMNKTLSDEKDKLSLLSQCIDDQAQRANNKQIKRQLKVGQIMNKQKGNINIKKIISFCYSYIKNINFYLSIVGVLIVLLLSGNIYNYYISKHLIKNNYTIEDFIGLAFILSFKLLLIKAIFIICSKISDSLFTKFQNKTLNCQSLNRISGDISAIDRSLPTNLFEFINYLLFIISSYLYSIISLQNLYIQIGLFIFSSLCLVISYRANRYIMLSRREVTRSQCLLKAKIIKRLMKDEKINQSPKIKKTWRQIFECKQMGLMVQLYFIGFLNIVLMILSLIIIGFSKYLDLQQADKSILFIACLNIDYDILKMFIYSIRLQVSLVSFERVINVIEK